MFCLCEKTAE